MNYPLLAAIAISLALTPWVEAAEPRTITIEGYGEVKTEPDMARVDVAISVIDKDIIKAKKVVDKTMATLLEVAEEMKIAKDDITATELSVQPDIEYKENERIIRYDTSRRMVITLRDLKKLDQLLTACFEAGINRVESIDLKTSKDDELRRKATSLAIADAKSRAKAIASEFGAELGDVQSITTGRHSYIPSYFIAASTKVGGPESYHAGRIEISSEIDVVFQLK